MVKFPVSYDLPSSFIYRGIWSTMLLRSSWMPSSTCLHRTLVGYTLAITPSNNNSNIEPKWSEVSTKTLSGFLTIHNFGPTSFFPRYLIYRVMTKSVNLTKLVRLRTMSLTINRLACPCVIFQDKQSFLLDLISVELMRNVTMSLCVYLLSCLLPF